MRWFDFADSFRGRAFAWHAEIPQNCVACLSFAIQARAPSVLIKMSVVCKMDRPPCLLSTAITLGEKYVQNSVIYKKVF